MRDVPSRTDWDVIIIGGGPAGATAALYAARADLSTLVVDKGRRVGALGTTQKIANFPGILDVLTGDALLDRMWEHAMLYGAEILKKRVARCALLDEDKMVTTADEIALHGRAVILSTGAMGPAAVVPGEAELVECGVSYCATSDAPEFRGRPVFVYGGTEEAAEEAAFAARFASQVLYAYPKSALQIPEDLDAELDALPNLERLPRHRLLAVEGEDAVTGVRVRTADREETTLAVEGVFVFTGGTRPIVDYLDGAVDLTDEGYVHVDEQMCTSLPGVFACGDVLANRVQQAVVAAAQGCVAALSADKYLNRRTRHRRDYD